MKKIPFNSGWCFRAENSAPVEVTLPHDAMQLAGRSPDAPSGNSGAHYLGGRYVYEKVFTLSDTEAGETVTFQFDGVYRNARVFVNGVRTGSACYGYLPFFSDATGIVHAGKNTIRVEAENAQLPASRWYSGAGIYRAVWMWMGSPCHIAPLGIRIRTLGIRPAKIYVSTVHTGGEAEITIWDVDRCVARAVGSEAELEIPDARLWSDKAPNLYRCHVTLRQNGLVTDEAEQLFGIRTLRYDSTGFYVNGERTMLRGGCLHHDNGILGACCIPEAETRRLTILKQYGFNAIRCAHNPAATDLLDACDRLGIYVMDEMWDMWYLHKNPYDYAAEFMEHWRGDVAAVTARDYSHPSVILYSIGNENTEPCDARGIALGQEIIDLFHKLDSSRPVTIGLNMALVAMAAMGVNLVASEDGAPQMAQPPAVNSTVFNETVSRNNQMNLASCRPEVDALASPLLDAVDIAGYNYAVPRYALDAEVHPGRVSVGSETFPHELAATWKTIEACPYIIGDFMWTAWDYIGECSIGTWACGADALEFAKPYPWKLGDVGALDLLGDPTGEALWARAVWLGQTSLGVRPVTLVSEQLARGAWRGTNAIPSWSWRSCEGMNAEVEVYTPGVRVEIQQNGAVFASAETRDMRALVQIPYRPGTLKAVAYDKNGTVCGSAVLCSAKGTATWQIGCEADRLTAGQVAFFPICLADEAGITESNADETLTVAVSGGTLLGFGSAAPRTEAEFSDGRYPSRYGRALAAVRVGESECVTLTVTAESGTQSTQSFPVTISE